MPNAMTDVMLKPEVGEAMAEYAEGAADLLRAMGNAHRLQVLCILADREMSVSELNETIPLSQSALSQHLARLRNDGLVRTRREGQVIYYSVMPGPALSVIGVLQQYFCP